MRSKRQHIGPGAMIAAAFIGPGTVTTATLAGGNFGFTLLWAIAFSVLATLILQEMTARLGVVGKRGLGEAIAQKTRGRLLYWPMTLLVIAAVFIGNAAYEAGNITGAIIGLPRWYLGDVNLWAVGIGFIAFMVLSTGRTPLIERVLVLLVAGMAAVFLWTAIITQPSIAGIASGLLTPSIPENAAMLVVGLIGTTVVPYNLFLHASAVKNHAISGVTLKEARQDIALSVVGGGLITLCIVITAAASLHGTGKPITSLSQIAPTLEPLMGAAAAAVLTVGFFAAGLSSAITAPLAAAYAVTEILALNEQRREQVFRWTWLLVLGVGVLFASFSLKPLQLILFAQVANGLLLPVCAAFILWIANDRSMLQQHTNTGLQNLSGVFVIAITLILGARSLSLAAGWL